MAVILPLSYRGSASSKPSVHLFSNRLPCIISSLLHAGILISQYVSSYPDVFDHDALERHVTCWYRPDNGMKFKSRRRWREKEEEKRRILRKSTWMAINRVYPPAKLGLSYAYSSHAIINPTICMNTRAQHDGVESEHRAIFRGIIIPSTRITRARDRYLER